MVALCPIGSMSEMMYKGKVKQVWSTDDPDIIEFRYTDQISVFDQIIPSLIPRKGESLNRASCHWFRLIEKFLRSTRGNLQALSCRNCMEEVPEGRGLF